MHYNLRHGNLTSRSDSAMVFNYGEFGHSPHALTSVDAPIGSCQNRSVSYSYTDFKMLESAASGEDSIHITYGADLQRRKMQVFRNGRLSLTRYYFSNYEEEHYADGRIRKIDYITGPKGLIGVNISSDGTDTLLHAFTDKFGNLVLLADADGNVVERLAYDPWGARRNPADWTKADTACHAVPRGYSMHEHLDRLGLINMNARVYDVTTCSFLSPDPLIADEGNWLNYNRYLYCLGNPVKFADPTGMYATYNDAVNAQRNAIFQGYETGPIFRGYGTGDASFYFNTVSYGENGEYVVTANYSGHGAYSSADYGALMEQNLRSMQAINAIIDENNRRMQESIMTAVKVDVPEVKVEVELYRPEPSVWNKMGNAVVGALEAGDRFADNVLYPIYSGLILYIPAVGFTNDVHTLAYDEDIYGNYATSTDKIIAVADLATFGIAKCLKILSITNRLCKIVGYGNTVFTSIGAFSTAKNNIGQK